jgi:hypothetical protein
LISDGHIGSMATLLTLYGTLNELSDSGDAIVRQVAMICHSVQTRTWASLVIRSWGYERIRASRIDVLRFGIEWASTTRGLSLLATGIGTSLFEVL